MIMKLKVSCDLSSIISLIFDLHYPWDRHYPFHQVFLLVLSWGMLENLLNFYNALGK